MTIFLLRCFFYFFIMKPKGKRENMKFILSLIVCLILPFSAMATDCDVSNEDSDQQETACNAMANCYWSTTLGCQKCSPNAFSAAGANTCTTITDTSTYYKNNEGSNVSLCPNQTPEGIIETAEVQTYIGTCECIDHTRRLIHSYNGITHFYYCGICGFNSLQPFEVMGATGDLYECNCAAAHANHVYGSTAESNNGTRSECACAKDANGHSFLNNGLCMCGSNPSGQDPYSSTNNGITTYSCCPGRSTYNSTTGNCECNITYAQKTYDNNNILTQCECVAGSLSNDKSKCVCGSNQIVTFGQNNNQGQYLSSCTSCTDANSQPASGDYPRFCKCNKGYYQDHESNASDNYRNQTCSPCLHYTTTTSTGSVGPESCRLMSNTEFSISAGGNFMKLIPQGATILPIYTDPYVQNNNNPQSQYSY